VRNTKAKSHVGLVRQLQSLLPSGSHHPVTIGSLFKTLGDEGHLSFILLLALPFCLPLPLPGISIPFGIIIFLLAFYSVLGLKPWLPNWLLKLKINGKKATKALRAGIWIASKLEKALHPRGLWLTEQGWLLRIHCLVIALMGSLLALPLPPGTNFPPAFIIVLMALGIIERDAFYICASYLVAIATLGVVTGLWFAAPNMLQPLWNILNQIWGG